MEDAIDEARTLRELVQKDRTEIERLRAALRSIKELENVEPEKAGPEAIRIASEVLVNNP